LIYKNVNYDPVKGFAPVAALGTTSNLLVVNPALPVKSLQELIALARANPGKLNYASAGIGTPPHLIGEMFKQRLNLDNPLLDHALDRAVGNFHAIEANPVAASRTMSCLAAAGGGTACGRSEHALPLARSRRVCTIRCSRSLTVLFVRGERTLNTLDEARVHREQGLARPVAPCADRFVTGLARRSCRGLDGLGASSAPMTRLRCRLSPSAERGILTQARDRLASWATAQRQAHGLDISRGAEGGKDDACCTRGGCDLAVGLGHTRNGIGAG
jgi:hypothetical protein